MKLTPGDNVDIKMVDKVRSGAESASVKTGDILVRARRDEDDSGLPLGWEGTEIIE